MLAKEFGIDISVTYLILWSLTGALMRALFGLYKSYQTKGYVIPDYKRIFVEVVCAVAFGSLGVVLLADTGLIKAGILFGPSGVALLGGFFGADLINKLVDMIGVPKGVGMVVEKLPASVGLNPNQVKALEFASKYGIITTTQYKNLNSCTDGRATKELGLLVKKGFLHKEGNGGAVRYLF